jgi:hypothetical protein
MRAPDHAQRRGPQPAVDVAVRSSFTDCRLWLGLRSVVNADVSRKRAKLPTLSADRQAFLPMPHVLTDIARALMQSRIHAFALYLLSNVPGFPPVIQTVHILGITAVMGSIVMIDLKVLGLALPSQSTGELVGRVMPWLWWALPVQAISGLTLILARPLRYAINPVFGLKFTMLAPAVLLAAIFHLGYRSDPYFWERSSGHRASARIIAGLSLLLWIGVVFAGRWIAYADYFFAME